MSQWQKHPRSWSFLLIGVLVSGWAITSYQCYHYREAYQKVLLHQQSPVAFLKLFTERYFNYTPENFLFQQMKAMELMSDSWRRKVANESEKTWEKVQRQDIKQTTQVVGLWEDLSRPRFLLKLSTEWESREERKNFTWWLWAYVVPKLPDSLNAWGWAVEQVLPASEVDYEFLTQSNVLPVAAQKFLEWEIPCDIEEVERVWPQAMHYYLDSAQPKLSRWYFHVSLESEPQNIALRCKNNESFVLHIQKQTDWHTHYFATQVKLDSDPSDLGASQTQTDKARKEGLVKSAAHPMDTNVSISKTEKVTKKKGPFDKQAFRKMLQEQFGIKEVNSHSP